jgi:uncharacterized phage protein (TIGR01671 family)
MREIKFRAWDKINEIMCLVNSIELDVAQVYLGAPVVGMISMEDVALLQYTGLLDKQGKEIYEGDIVRFEYYDEMIVNDNDVQKYSEDAQITKVQSRGVIKGDFEECQLWLIDWAMDSDYIFEIIGNIYENPEYLNQGEGN